MFYTIIWYERKLSFEFIESWESLFIILHNFKFLIHAYFQYSYYFDYFDQWPFYIKLWTLLTSALNFSILFRTSWFLNCVASVVYETDDSFELIAGAAVEELTTPPPLLYWWGWGGWEWLL